MTQMQAIRIHEFGGPDVLVPEKMDLPRPGADQALVRIRAASVNPVDAKTRAGKFPPVGKDALPLTLGRDLSGTVESCGPGLDARKGDDIFALLGYDRGAYAQYVLVEKSELAPKPDNLSHVEAASVPLAALTAWQGMLDHGHLQSGERVLIHGAAGGVGHFAVQIAKAKGAWVAATCGKDDMAFVRRLGADQVIDYKNEKFEDEVADIDLVFDLIGGDTQARSFAVLKNGGALVSTLQQPDKAMAAKKNLRIAHYMTEADAAELDEIGDLLRTGQIEPHIFAIFPLAEAARAENLLEKGHIHGKVVLTVPQDEIH